MRLSYFLHQYRHISCSSYLIVLWDGRQMVVQLLFCEVLLPGCCSRQHAAFLCSFHLVFSLCVFVNVHVVHPYSSMDTVTLRKKSGFYFIGTVRLCMWLTDSLSIAVQPFPMKGNLGITKNYRGVILTAIAAKVYNTQLLNHIQLEIEKIPRKNKNRFQRNQ